MKVLTSTQLREADRITAELQHITSFQLMQRAAAACADVICNRYGPEVPVTVFCGTGNNGGDGLCIARILHRIGYAVVVQLVNTSSQPSGDFMLAREAFLETPGTLIREGIAAADDLSNTLIIDALFGTGLKGPATGPGQEAINYINNSGAAVISIDLPSGMPADPVNAVKEYTVVHAALTITFHCPKLSMLLPGYGEYAGEVVIADIGLDHEYTSHIPDRYHLVDASLIQKLYRPRPRFSHKGTFGHALIVSGSKGKIGASLLAAKACLRSGAGLLTLHLPGCGYIPAQTAVPEAMVSSDPGEDHITTLPEIDKYTAIGIGPGIGLHPETTNVLKQVLSAASGVPLVVDADALNILSAHPELLKQLHPNSILTPHPGEFRRLAGDWNGDAEMLQQAEQFANRHHCILVLKGHRTLITDGAQTWFNVTGNSGMAKGGTGDVLTGLITGLAASGYDPLSAAILGVYFHGHAGDQAATRYGTASMTTGDLLRFIRIR